MLPLSDLKPITIPELILGTRHTGRALFVRTFGTARRNVGVENAIEDIHGNVDRISIYNLPLSYSAQQLLPKQCVIAVKEPYYEATADGGYAVRVDHPSDLVHLPADSLVIPPQFCSQAVELHRSAQAWKDSGNKWYNKHYYLRAVGDYTQGMNACSEEHKLVRADLYRNRSVANIRLGRFELAIADAQQSLLPALMNDDKVHKYNAKALFRAGCASYALGQFDEAKHNFDNAIKIAPDDADAIRESAKVADRLKEMAIGEYDTHSMNASARTDQRRLDHANFTRNVNVRAAGRHGRGLFATRAIKTGEIIMCEKAFDICFDRDNGESVCTVFNIKTGHPYEGSHAVLLFRIIEKLRFNPQLARRFLDLHDGGHQPKYAAQQVDGNTVIDTFEVQAIMEHNCFAAGGKDSLLPPLGIWITASRINHACNGNACRVTFGDMMILTATRDIAQDEEILTPYLHWNADPTETAYQLQIAWAFTCDCPICIAERKTSPSLRQERQATYRKIETILAVHECSPIFEPGQEDILQVEALYHKLLTTYDQAAFKGIPYPALIKPSNWLCQVYNTPTSVQKCKAYAMAVLQNLGYEVRLGHQSISIEPGSGSLIDIAAVDAAMHLCEMHLLKAPAISEACEKFARTTYRVLRGESHGFDARYADYMR